VLLTGKSFLSHRYSDNFTSPNAWRHLDAAYVHQLASEQRDASISNAWLRPLL